MPFAGLEVVLVAIAFRVLSQHDADFERLEIGDHEVRWRRGARGAHALRGAPAVGARGRAGTG
jgi:uncharacterized membrane protein